MKDKLTGYGRLAATLTAFACGADSDADVLTATQASVNQMLIFVGRMAR